MIISRNSNNCPSTQVYHDESYVLEVYAWTVLGILAFVARYAVRLRILPWRKLQGDDWVGIAVLLFFIGLSCVKLAVYHLGANSDYTEEELRRLSECQLGWIEFGSRLQVSAWYFYACFLWGLKTMILFLFNRLTLPAYQRRLFKIFAVLAALTYIAVVLTISCSCRPFHRNWGTIPYPPPRCTSRIQNFYTASILNILTDAAILLIALPMLWNLRVPLSRKIALTLLLCSGIFIISAAIIAMLMSLLDAHSTLNTNRWATREEITGILTVNAPIIKPMFYRSFWRKDFTNPRMTVRPHRAMRAPPVIDTRLIAETPQPVRRLGVLSSLRSDNFGQSSTKDGSSIGAGETSSPRKGEDYKIGTEIKEMEAAWSMREGDGSTIADPQDVAREAPQPLLPEATASWSSRGGSLPWSDLHSINEDEKGKKSRGT